MKAHRARLVLALVVAAFAWTALFSHEGKSGVPSWQNGETVWDGVYSLDQTERGRTIFELECVRCHDVSDFVGEDYMATWEGQTLREFYLYISSGMPPDLHEEITDFQAYADILAYVLFSNDFPVGDRDLSSNLGRLGRVRIEAMP
jgi:hypothetical protein